VIAEAKVTKDTFYRHFPSKKDLICEYLAYRHRLWMAWFEDALQRHSGLK
jgi:AcrR family transcriptional regulator